MEDEKKQPAKPVRVARYPFRVAKQMYRLPAINHELETQHENIDKLAAQVTFLTEEAAHLRNKAEAKEGRQEDLKQRLDRLDNRLNDLMHQLTIMNEERRAAPSKATKRDAAPASDLLADEHLLDHFYVEFERWFRGTDEEIAERQKVYLPYFTGSKVNAQKYPSIDIGCGRGEFVQLLQDNGVHAIGLDLNKAMVERVKEKGLEGVQDDALSYLRKQKTNSLMAITGFHIVEHIPFMDLVRIFDECYRTLQPNGFVIFETPNPENLIVGSCNFYADPSHLHPLPPAFLEFVLKTRGFNKTEIKRLHPIKENIKDDNPLVSEMAERIYGPQDYAVIAHK